MLIEVVGFVDLSSAVIGKMLMNTWLNDVATLTILAGTNYSWETKVGTHEVYN